MRNSTANPIFSDFKLGLSRVVRSRPLVKGNEDAGYEGGGKYSESGSAQKDKKRAEVHKKTKGSTAKQKSSQQQRRVRKKVRVGKLNTEEERKSMEGTSYGAGKFNDVDLHQFSSSSDDDLPLAQLQSKNSKKK